VKSVTRRHAKNLAMFFVQGLGDATSAVAAFNWNPARHQLESVAALRWNTRQGGLSLPKIIFARSDDAIRTRLVW
jgi:hypothetical protein